MISIHGVELAGHQHKVFDQLPPQYFQRWVNSIFENQQITARLVVSISNSPIRIRKDLEKMPP